jgi:hypothetical protein
MSYYFFHTIDQNENLLKEWVKIQFPLWKISFSAPGWVTFKTPAPLELRNIPQFPCPLALRWGIGLDIIKTDPSFKELLKSIQRDMTIFPITDLHYFEIAEIPSIDKNLSSAISKKFPMIFFNRPLSSKSICLHVFKIDDSKFAMGITHGYKFQGHFPGNNAQIELPPHSPSRAYLKIAQIVQQFQLIISEKDCVFELGASPGGITTYFLDKKCVVYAVDTAPLKIQHERLFTMIESVQHLNADHIPKNTHWLVSDLNLSPKQMIQEVIRLGATLKNLKGILLTVKLPKMETIRHLQHYEKLMEKNFPTMSFSYFQVPSHKKETHLIGLPIPRRSRLV